MRTARYLAGLGHDVVFREIDNTPGATNPDVEMDGVTWEFKAPKGAGKNTISNQFKRARRQSSHVVIDLRRCGLDDDEAKAQIEARFVGQSRITDLMVIDHAGRMTRHSKDR